MKVKTSVKAGGLHLNHNDTLVSARGRTKRLSVRTGIKAGSPPRLCRYRILC